MTTTILPFCWAKTGADDSYHPVACHLADVAAVALELTETVLAPRPRDLATLGGRLLPAQVAFLVGAHDVGKVAPGFQNKAPHLTTPLCERGLPFPAVAEASHAAVTQRCLSRQLERFGVQRGAGDIARAVAAHHGSFLQEDLLAPRSDGGGAISRSCQAA